MIKVLIYEDIRELRESLTLLINGSEGLEVLAAYPNCDNVMSEVEAFVPDVILMDIDMPGITGVEALARIREVNQQVKILMLTVFDDNEHVFQAIAKGANGYLLKKTKPAQLIEYIEEAHTGGAPMTSAIATQVLKMFSGIAGNRKEEDYNLTEREKQVLQLLVDGYSYKMIAAEKFIAIDTVRSHIKKIYEKLQVNSKSEAISKVLKGKAL
jgi:DNA-binding NarL/FixJ family response regulator